MSSGYLIAAQFETLYEHALNNQAYDDHPQLSKKRPIYGIPLKEFPEPREDTPRYRGIDREPLDAMSYEEAKILREAEVPVEANDATALLQQIQDRTGREDGWVTRIEDILAIWKLLGERQSAYELIFGRTFDDTEPVPGFCEFLGWDSAQFVDDYFSCICDALFFPRWHGTDKEGTLFKKHYDSLNKNGLFDTNEQATDYLNYYLSFDWTEHGSDMTTVEVYSVNTDILDSKV